MLYIVFIICHTIFHTCYSLEADPGDGRHSKDKADDLKQGMRKFPNETSELENLINKSEVKHLIRLKKQYLLKNYIDDLETLYAFFFVPDWTLVNLSDRPARRGVDIRRQKWKHIFDEAGDSIFVQRLNSELKKCNLNQSKFIDEIAETYFTLSDNSVLNGEPDSQPCSDPLQKESVTVLMEVISKLELDQAETKKMVELPRSIYKYTDSMQNRKRFYEDYIRILKEHHEDRVQRLKEQCRERIHEANHHGWLVESWIKDDY